MKIVNITVRAVGFIVLFSFLMFMIGLFETIRVSYMFPIGEIFINPVDTPAHIYDDYLETINSYVFTNLPLIYLANFVGLVLTFYLMKFAWNSGYNALPMRISEVFAVYNLLLILVMYFGIIISQYLIDTLINQFIRQLFEEIYQSVYMYQLYVEWFVYLLVIAYLISFLANYIRHFDIINN